MESPRKFNDCYFYYYSTCTKGDNCVFRHEPSALGCETMCTAWQQGKCLDKRCKLRHMELRKNRKQIPCYWENQPGGCRKKHCPFMHKNPDARTDGIAPSQPAPITNAIATNNMPEPSVEPPMPTGVPTGVPTPTPVPLLWQQPRQVVLDSAILGVLPASSELLGARRVLPHAAHSHAHAHAHSHAHSHAHAHAHDAPASPYAPMPVDPLVVNFEEESDNESGPSSTPTKDAASPAAKSHELLLLERIQAEAAAFYSYAPEPRSAPAGKYDRLSLDEIAGKQQVNIAAERRSSLDFKVLSLDEIRARKRGPEPLIHTKPITLNLSRKRKLSTQETITTSGNKIIKVVSSNSIVYKKVDGNAPPTPSPVKIDQRKVDEVNDRKRTLSEHSDIYEMEDELVDNCFEFKRIKIAEQTSKPRLIRNRHKSASNSDCRDDDVEFTKQDNDSDAEVQFVSVELSDTRSSMDKLLDTDVIDVDSAKMGEPIDIVDLCEDPDDGEITASDLDLDLVKNVPDVVASCRKSCQRTDGSEKDVLNDIDALLSDEL